MMRDGGALPETPSQTAGPYVHIGCVPNSCGITGVIPEDLGGRLYQDGAEGQAITVTGCVWDGADAPMGDVLIELWHADHSGFFPGNDPRGKADPRFSGFGRIAANPETGEWRCKTIKPGRVPSADGRLQAPHITVWIVARGINIGLHTRMYFSDEDNSVDPVLAQIDDQSRVETLIAKRGKDGTYRFDIRIQGNEETVFFDV